MSMVSYIVIYDKERCIWRKVKIFQGSICHVSTNKELNIG